MLCINNIYIYSKMYSLFFSINFLNKNVFIIILKHFKNYWLIKCFLASVVLVTVIGQIHNR